MFCAGCKGSFSFMTACYITVILLSTFLLLQNNILMDSCLQILFSSNWYPYFETFQLAKLFAIFLKLTHLFFYCYIIHKMQINVCKSLAL